MLQFSNLLAGIKYSIAISKKAIEDVLVSLIPQVVALITSLVAAVLIARGLGPEGMGKYALIISVSTLIVGLSDLGFGQTAIRFASRAVAEGDEKKQFAVLRWAFRRRLTLSLLISLSVVVLAPYIAGDFWHDETLTHLLQLGLLIGIFGTLAHIPIIYFQSLKRFRMNTIVLSAQSLISFAVILIVAWLNAWSVALIIAASIIASAAGAVTFLLIIPSAAIIDRKELSAILHQRLHLALRRSSEQLKSTFHSPELSSFAFYMLIASLVVTITLQLDIWLMGYFLSKDQVGIYSVATRFTLPLLMVSTAVNTALWPRISAIVSQEKTIEVLKHTFQFSLIAGLGCTFYALLAPLLTPIVFGSAYEGSILLAQILCLGYCLVVIFSPLGVIGYNFGLVRAYAVINVAQLLVVFCIDFALLPIIGPLAAALGFVANATIGYSITSALIWKEVKHGKTVRDLSVT